MQSHPSNEFSPLKAIAVSQLSNAPKTMKMLNLTIILLLTFALASSKVIRSNDEDFSDYPALSRVGFDSDNVFQDMPEELVLRAAEVVDQNPDKGRTFFITTLTVTKTKVVTAETTMTTHNTCYKTEEGISPCNRRKRSYVLNEAPYEHNWNIQIVPTRVSRDLTEDDIMEEIEDKLISNDNETNTDIPPTIDEIDEDELEPRHEHHEEESEFNPSDKLESSKSHYWIEREIIGFKNGCFDAHDIAHRFITVLETEHLYTTVTKTSYVTSAEMQTVSFAKAGGACLPNNIEKVFSIQCF